ncbi:TetR/AcrR family transcriptional regulator [Nocardioides sp. HM23]|uniref:TetR/AcrR family transcriptional regulator n=1 Tax=Nocardioides bizhenqiangii TaxID=3095076 RepID=UPI002ACABE88|nr:TetR/AcrR family transcriptional regulator [Nocardioides sp. HM23]MDZ5620926.1 TetR/AcrR family transcriptional regulator [Nocardioides sp. HM23]
MSAVKRVGATRREKAAATRERMLRAAIEVFAEAGYVGARMADIAARAGVAVQTVYFVFHTKPELLQACFDYAVLGPERLVPPEQTPFREIATARSGRAALRAFVAGNTAILERVATTDEVARAALHEPEAAAVVKNSERLRRDGYRDMLATVAERFALRSGLSLDDATDILLMYGSSATYLSMVRAGWSRDRFEDWLTDTLARTFLARPGR